MDSSVADTPESGGSSHNSSNFELNTPPPRPREGNNYESGLSAKLYQLAGKSHLIWVIFSLATVLNFIPGIGGIVNLPLGVICFTLAALSVSKVLPLYNREGQRLSWSQRAQALKMLRIYRTPHRYQAFNQRHILSADDARKLYAIERRKDDLRRSIEQYEQPDLLLKRHDDYLFDIKPMSAEQRERALVDPSFPCYNSHGKLLGEQGRQEALTSGKLLFTQPPKVLSKDLCQEELSRLEQIPFPIVTSDGEKLLGFERQKLLYQMIHRDEKGQELAAHELLYILPPSWSLQQCQDALDDHSIAVYNHEGVRILGDQRQKHLEAAVKYLNRTKVFLQAQAFTPEQCAHALLHLNVPVYDKDGQLLEKEKRERALMQAKEPHNTLVFVYHAPKEATIEDIGTFNQKQRLTALLYALVALYSIVNGLMNLAISITGPFALLFSTFHGMSVFAIMAQSTMVATLMFPKNLRSFAEKVARNLRFSALKRTWKQISETLSRLNFVALYFDALHRYRESDYFQSLKPDQRKEALRQAHYQIAQKTILTLIKNVLHLFRAAGQRTGLTEFCFDMEAQMSRFRAAQGFVPLLNIPLLGAAMGFFAGVFYLTRGGYFLAKALLSFGNSRRDNIEKSFTSWMICGSCTLGALQNLTLTVANVGVMMPIGAAVALGLGLVSVATLATETLYEIAHGRAPEPHQRQELGSEEQTLETEKAQGHEQALLMEKESQQSEPEMELPEESKPLIIRTEKEKMLYGLEREEREGEHDRLDGKRGG